MATPVQRFLALTDKDSGDCWLWTGRLNWAGYASFWFDGRTVKAHRWSYQHHVGPIPDGMQLDHLCRVRHCVNPEHLEPVTNRENSLRGIGPTAINAAKTHCKRGHEFTPENTYRDAKGRMCRACKKLTDQRRKP